jgi:hypothetical protein
MSDRRDSLEELGRPGLEPVLEPPFDYPESQIPAGRPGERPGEDPRGRRYHGHHGYRGPMKRLIVACDGKSFDFYMVEMNLRERAWEGGIGRWGDMDGSAQQCESSNKDECLTC